MVKKIIIFLFLMLYNSNIAQEKEAFWWVQTPLNKKYEENYKHLFSEIKDGILKDQIIVFIKKHIISTCINKEEVAIEVSSLFSKKRNEKIYKITYISNYYNFIPYLNVNQIAEIKGRIIFIQDKNLNDFKIKKEVLFGILRDRHPKITKRNNNSFSKEGSFTEDWVLEHQIPSYILTIKNNELVDKKLTLE